MFFDKHWNVLIIDDEPDILSVTKLVMKDIKVYGIPLKIHTATSKEEAINLLDSRFKPHSGWSPLAAAFIDVVMESETAGLDICDYIRSEQNNDITQIFIRTGQPGVAPERSVIDKYDITGYLTKVDATGPRLYALVKPCIRQYRWGITEQWALNAITETVAGARSQRKIVEGINRHFHQTLLAMAGGVGEGQTLRLGLSLDGVSIIRLGLTADDETELRRKFKNTDKQQQINSAGDSFALTDANEFMVNIKDSSKGASVQLIGQATGDAPDFVFTAVHAWLKALSILWLHADADLVPSKLKSKAGVTKNTNHDPDATSPGTG